MDTSIPGDYDILLNLYKHLKKDFEGVKQNLHESTRQLKVNESLIREYQGEIEILQSGETVKFQKYEARIANLEETLANLRSTHLQNFSSLESELSQKEKFIEDMKMEMDLLKRKDLLEDDTKVSFRNDELLDLLSQNELLQEKYDELLDEFGKLRMQHIEMEQTLEEYKEQNDELKETVNSQREIASEKSVLIDKLNDELLIANRDLEIYKNKPLQVGSKGNSLFAEVDDRRVHLQKTVNNMKSNYIYLRQEHSKHEKIISHLRKENAELRSLWNKDLEQIQEDHNLLLDSLNNRLEVMDEMNKRLKLQVDQQQRPSSDDPCSEYQFYEDIIESKCAEIKKLEKNISDRCLTEHMLSSSFAQANKELRLLKLQIIDLQQQIDENKEKELMAREAELYRRYTDYNGLNNDSEIDEIEEDILKSNIKSCLKSIENVYQEDLNTDNKAGDSLTKDEHDKVENLACNLLKNTVLTNDENRGNTNINCSNSDFTRRRGVKFTQDTSSPASNPVRRRGTKIVIMKKKN